MLKIPCRLTGEKSVGVLIVFIYALLAIFLTRPLLSLGSDHVHESIYDPLFQAWTLAWDNEAMTGHPADLFDANIFYPNDKTLTYSDHQVVNALIAMPIFAISDNPILAVNMVLIFNLFLCAVGAYLLARELTGSTAGAFTAGLIFAFAAPRFAHMGHLQLSGAAFIPLCLLFLHRFLDDGGWKNALLAATFFLLQTLTTWYYGMILVFAVLLFLLIAFVTKWSLFTWRKIALLLGSFTVACLLLLPFALPYLGVQGEDARFGHTVEELDLFSADITDFFAAPENSMTWGGLLSGPREKTESRGGETERTLFVGAFPILLGIAGVVWLSRKGRETGGFSATYYPVLAGASFLMCMGTRLNLFGHDYAFPMPYRFFFFHFPGFSVMRVPGRFIILVILSLAVLSAYAVAAGGRMLQERSGGRPLLTVGIPAIFFILLLFDIMTTAVPLTQVPRKEDFDEVYHWLAEQQGEAPTVEFPLAEYDTETFRIGLQYEESWAQREAWRTYYSTLHWKRIFNGYSGFIPGSYYDGVKACKDFLTAPAVEYFRSVGIRYIIVHGDEMERWQLDQLLEDMAGWKGIARVVNFGNDHLFMILNEGQE